MATVSSGILNRINTANVKFTQGVNTATLLANDSNGTSYSLPYNPNTTSWSYDLNRQAYDTYGGRVIQLLSVTTQSMTLEGEAGSRARLLQLFADMKSLQAKQIELQTPATLSIPLSFVTTGSVTQSVWFDSMEITANKNSVTYPYRIMFQIQEGSGQDTIDTTLQSVMDTLSFAQGYIGFYGQGRYQGVNSNSISVSQLSGYIYDGNNIGAKTANAGNKVNSDGSYNV